MSFQIRISSCDGRAITGGQCWLITGGILGYLANIEDLIGLFTRVERFVDPDVDPQKLTALFGAGPAPAAAILPAGDHPFVRPAGGKTWYPIEEACSVAYQRRFAGHIALRKVQGFPRLQPGDSAIVFGSQVSNLTARHLLGNPWRPEPLFSLVGPGWSAKLHWNLHSPPDAPRSERRQYGGHWLTVEHEIVSANSEVYRADKKGLQQEDYLLITALPRAGARSERTIIFGGIHGAGTLAAERLFRQPPPHLVTALFDAIEGARHYQALVRVAVARDAKGEPIPGRLDLVDARPLDVTLR